jgi:hypothetical protein
MRSAELKKSTEDNAVILATNELDAAIEDVEEHDRSYAAYERLCRSMSDVCKAYAEQLIPSLKPAQVPIQPFPFQAAERLHGLLEELLAGNLSPMARTLVKRSGARGHTMLKRRAIYVACKYMQAVEKEWIADRSPVLRIATLYGVDRATAQGWRRNEKRDLLPKLDEGVGRAAVLQQIKDEMVWFAAKRPFKRAKR